jgi:hypothetical protein
MDSGPPSLETFYITQFDVAAIAATHDMDLLRCIDPVESAQARLLKHKLHQGFAYQGPSGAAGGCKSQSSQQ